MTMSSDLRIFDPSYTFYLNEDSSDFTDEQYRQMAAAFRVVRLRLSDPSRWLKDRICLDATGHAVSMYSDDAAAWCLRAAIASVCKGMSPKNGFDLTCSCVDFLKLYTGADSLMRWNASVTHAQLLRTLDKVIFQLSGEGVGRDIA